MNADVHGRGMTTETHRGALVEALREARARARGPMRAALIFECHQGPCPVTTIRVEAVERPGGKLIQPRMLCPRCREELAFIELSSHSARG